MPRSSSDQPKNRRNGDGLDGLRDLEKRNRNGRKPPKDDDGPVGRHSRRPLSSAKAGDAGRGGDNGRGGDAGRSPREPEPAPRSSRSSRDAEPRSSHRSLRQAAPAGSRRGGVPRLRMRRRWPGRILIAINLIVALGILGTVGAYAYVHAKLAAIHKIKVDGLTSASGPFTLLIVGSDSRSALHGAGNAEYGSAASTPGQRSDTIMLARIVPAQHTLTLMSIPRDLFVNIKGIGQSRINAAFNNGPNLLISTIKTDLGIPINHYVEVNFDSFKDITDAVGGVKFYFPTPVRDLYSNLYVPKAGCVNLTGNQALGFARSRHYEYEVNGQWLTQGLSDLARIQRQQAFVKKMIKKAETRFTDPLALNNIIDSVTKNLTVDSGFTTGKMLSLAEDLRSVDVNGIPTETLPTTPTVIGGADVLTLDTAAAKTMIRKFNELGTSKEPVKKAAKKKATAKPATVTVQIANGSGVTHQAAKASRALKRLGYKTTVTSSSPGTNFTTNEIVYRPADVRAADKLAKKLAGTATLAAAQSLTSSPYDLELITGADYNGVATAHNPSTTKVASSTSTTSYLLPGPTPSKAALAACS